MFLDSYSHMMLGLQMLVEKERDKKKQAAISDVLESCKSALEV